MAHIVLVTGGSRSGKSRVAQEMGEQLAGPRLFVATCPVIDEEMAARVRMHQRNRDPGVWQTLEEPLRVTEALAREQECSVVLVDCLTLWVNNLMHQALRSGRGLTEEDMERESARMVHAAQARQGAVILVTNEVGMGIVPDNAQARLYRDLVGRCNQAVAAQAHQVCLVACGLSLDLKNVPFTRG